MFVEQEFKIGFKDIDDKYRMSNKALLGYLEDVAGKHSNEVGYGLLDSNETNLAWFLISWKVEVYKRPMYGEDITVVTWSKSKNKIYAFRNYEVLNSNKEVIAKASSKWVPIDTRTTGIMKLTDEIFDKYKSEPKENFEDEESFKLREPAELANPIEYKITRNMIDMMNHVHNTYYMDFVDEVLTEELRKKELNSFEIIYKKQIEYNEIVKIFLTENENDIYITIKSNDEKTVHAIIKLS